MLVLAGLFFTLPLVAPLVLTRARWHLRFPRIALGAWMLAFGGGIAAGVVLIIRSVFVALSVAETTSPGWGIALTLGAWATLGAVGGVVALVWSRAEPLSASQHRGLRQVHPLAVAHEHVGRFCLIHFESPEPLVFTGAPLSREIYVSSGLWNHLVDYQRQAVIAHEVMHLKFWHGPLVRLAEINAACLPLKLPAGREFKRSVMLLVELIADDAAARRIGPARYATTLVAMAGLTGEETLDLRARRLAGKNWRGPAVRAREFLYSLRITA